MDNFIWHSNFLFQIQSSEHEFSLANESKSLHIPWLMCNIAQEIWAQRNEENCMFAIPFKLLLLHDTSNISFVGMCSSWMVDFRDLKKISSQNLYLQPRSPLCPTSLSQNSIWQIYLGTLFMHFQFKTNFVAKIGIFFRKKLLPQISILSTQSR